MRERWRWCGQWWFLGSVALLAINDHVLKDTFSGWWTGKLSDVAGPVVVATLLAVVVGRTAGTVTAAVGFAVLKTVPAVAALAAPVLGGVTLTDPTDLVGLIALLPAWHFMERSPGPAPSPPLATGTGSNRTARRQRVVAVAGALSAVVATTATSPAEPPTYVGLTVVDSHIYTTESGYDDTPWARSDDGGLTWEPVPIVDVPDVARPEEPPDSTSTSTTLNPPPEEACRSDGWCFAATGESIDEKPPGGEWRRSFWFTDTQRDVAEYRGQGIRMFPFNAIAVVPTDTGENVVGTVDGHGVVILTVDGEWQQRPVLETEPADISDTVVPLRYAKWIAIAAGPLGVALALVQAWRRAKRGIRTGGAPFLAVLVGLVFWSACLVVWSIGTWQRWSPTLVAVGLVVLAVGAVVAPQVYLRRGRRVPDREV
ncbi:MAG: hypothetical protein JJE52_01565 [Acidimicrobiia bacterium]|nr:hypothetical protein [Acidimicrobiia bacterium]